MKKSNVLFIVLLAAWAAWLPAQEQPDQATNAQDEYVHMQAPQADGDGVLRIFRSDAKQEINQYVSEVVELRHAAAFEVVPHVFKAVKLEGGTARTLKYPDPATGKDRYFIQVVTTARQMPSVVKTIHDLDLQDVKSVEGDLKYAVRMKYRRASEVAEILDNTSLSGEGAVYADDISNTLWFKDSQSDSLRNMGYIEFYDVPPPQVEFDISMIEVSEDDTGKLGLDWNAWKQALGGQVNLTGNYFEGGGGFARLDGLLSLDALALAGFLNYAVQQGTADIHHRTRVTASNETPALVETFRRIPSYGYQKEAGNVSVVTEDTPEVDARRKHDELEPAEGKRTVLITPPATFRRADLGEEQFGLSIIIRPTIGASMVTTNVDIAALSLEGFSETDRPIVGEHHLSTQATLKNGEPFLMGAVTRNENIRYRRGIPFLKEIPGVKYLFSAEDKRVEKSKIFLIATPVFKHQLEYRAQAIRGGKLEKMFDVRPAYAEPGVPLPADAQQTLEQLAE